MFDHNAQAPAPEFMYRAYQVLEKDSAQHQGPDRRVLHLQALLQMPVQTHVVRRRFAKDLGPQFTGVAHWQENKIIEDSGTCCGPSCRCTPSPHRDTTHSIP